MISNILMIEVIIVLYCMNCSTVTEMYRRVSMSSDVLDNRYMVDVSSYPPHRQFHSPQLPTPTSQNNVK